MPRTSVWIALGAASALVLWGALPGAPASASHVESGEPIAAGHGSQLVIPIMNPERGKRLFVAKGCVACHAINGVGGHYAPALDAHTMERLMNPFDFAAKMWNHAPAMITAQEEAFGEQVYFTGAEFADVIAFVHDDETQHTFAESDRTPQARERMDHGPAGEAAPDAHADEIGHDHD